MPKSFTLDGKRYKLDARIPTGGIRWLMGRVHVGTPDDEVRADIRERAKVNGWPAELVPVAEAYALKCHHDNQALASYAGAQAI